MDTRQDNNLPGLNLKLAQQLADHLKLTANKSDELSEQSQSFNNHVKQIHLQQVIENGHWEPVKEEIETAANKFHNKNDLEAYRSATDTGIRYLSYKINNKLEALKKGTAEEAKLKVLEQIIQNGNLVEQIDYLYPVDQEKCAAERKKYHERLTFLATHNSNIAAADAELKKKPALVTNKMTKVVNPELEKIRARMRAAQEKQMVYSTNVKEMNHGGKAAPGAERRKQEIVAPQKAVMDCPPPPQPQSFSDITLSASKTQQGANSSCWASLWYSCFPKKDDINCGPDHTPYRRLE